MTTDMTVDRLRTYKRLASNWRICNYFGIITSSVERVNDVSNYLTELAVEDLIHFIRIDQKTKAFTYDADLGRKYPTHIVEIYYDWNLHGTEWRRRHAQLALQLDDDLMDGLDYDNVAVTELVVPYGETALEEVLLYN